MVTRSESSRTSAFYCQNHPFFLTGEGDVGADCVSAYSSLSPLVSSSVSAPMPRESTRVAEDVRGVRLVVAGLRLAGVPLVGLGTQAKVGEA